MHLPAHILAAAELNALNPAEFIAWCTETGLSATEASDIFAVQLAREYIEGRFAYVYCDRVMNSVMNVVTTQEFLSASNGAVPEVVKSVYLAFDKGDYVHSDDSPDENQEKKYTRPMIEAVLRVQRAA
jgi:hypothetical protein